ncbi:MAG: hypothetical protein M1833_004175, partial [Piccolia ochrophora]
MPGNVASPAEWFEARTALLAKEKEATRLQDAISAERRSLPVVEVKQSYTFNAPNGPTSLLDLFEGRTQLIV